MRGEHTDEAILTSMNVCTSLNDKYYYSTFREDQVDQKKIK